MSDTNEITNGCLLHYDNRHIQVRADFLGICQYSREEFAGRRKQEPNQECMAKIVRLMETLTDHARVEWKLKALKAEEKGLVKPFEPKRFPIELSNGAITHLLYKTFGESTVRNSLNYLLKIGYIGYEQEKANTRPRYWLEKDYIQAVLKAQAEVLLAGYEFRPPSYQGAISYPDGVISDPSALNSSPAHSRRGYDITGSGSESTDNNIDKREKRNDITDKGKKESTRAVFADAATAHAHLSLLEEDVTQGETDGSALDVSGDRGTGMAGLDCGEPVPEPELDDEETAERPAIRVGEVALHAQVSASKLVLEVEDRHSPLASEALPPMASDVGTFSMTPQEDTPPPVGAQTQVSSPAQLLPSPQPTTARPAAGSESPLSTTQRPADGKRQGKAEVPLMPRVGPPPMPPEDEVWGFPVILAMFDHWRGHEPITPKHMKQVNDCAIGLYRAGYTRALLVEIRKVMAEDEYYANRFVDLCDVANNAHKYRARAEANLKRALMPAQTQTSGRIINYTRQRKAEEARKAASLAQGGMN